jgi:hypothetical protein
MSIPIISLTLPFDNRQGANDEARRGQVAHVFLVAKGNRKSSSRATQLVPDLHQNLAMI